MLRAILHFREKFRKMLLRHGESNSKTVKINKSNARILVEQSLINFIWKCASHRLQQQRVDRVSEAETKMYTN